MIDLADGIDINKGDFAYFLGHFVDDKPWQHKHGNKSKSSTFLDKVEQKD